MPRPYLQSQRLSSLAFFVALALPLYAVDGVVLINQNAALAGNVTPGDAPGFPVTISVSGSYKLSSNLVLPDAFTDGIDINTNDVTIDLNGFSIIGPAVCLGVPPVCSAASGSGVSSLKDDITVFNGRVRGMAFGISLNGNATRVEKVQAIGNASIGIRAGAAGDSSVVGCTARGNAGDGIFVEGLAESNTALFNGGNGITVSGTAIHNVSVNNNLGISGSGTFIGNTARFNSTQGISANCRSTVVSNTAEGNVGGDIFTSGSGCTRANNAPAP